MAKYFIISTSMLVLFYMLVLTSSFVPAVSFDKVLYSDDSSSRQVSTNSDVEKRVVELTIQKGDTLNTILRNYRIPQSDIQEVTKLVTKRKIASQLQVNQKMVLHYNVRPNNSDTSITALDRIVLVKDRTRFTEIVKQDSQFHVRDVTVPLKKVITQYQANIDSNLVNSLKKSGLNINNITSLVNAYSYQIDLRKQVRSGDKITVMVEKFITDDNRFSHYGDILYANLTLQKNHYNRYKFSPTGKSEDLQFFSKDGKTVKNTFLQTPVKGARISSHYGYRKKHPIFGCSTMHKGVDFAASTGTPIYAAGDGVISFAGWKSGYGRFILIQHNNSISTAYAHSSKFAEGIKRGSRVKQGDLIAFVGRSGNVTGPHLHYEVRVNGKQVNPMKFKSMPGMQLTGTKLADFNRYQNKILNIEKKLQNDNVLDPKEINEIQLF